MLLYFSVSIWKHYRVLVSLFINAYLIYRDYNFLSQGHASCSSLLQGTSTRPRTVLESITKAKVCKTCLQTCLWRLELHVFLEYWDSPALTYLLEIKLLRKIPRIIKLTCKSIVKSNSIIVAFKINVFFYKCTEFSAWPLISSSRSWGYLFCSISWMGCSCWILQIWVKSLKALFILCSFLFSSGSEQIATTSVDGNYPTAASPSSHSWPWVFREQRVPLKQSTKIHLQPVRSSLQWYCSVGSSIILYILKYRLMDWVSLD